MTTDPNPFTGRTRFRSRPTWSLPEYRHLTVPDLHRAQTHWDQAEQARLAHITAEAARFAELMADDSAVEPASKALENRLRVAFLSRGHHARLASAPQHPTDCARRGPEHFRAARPRPGAAHTTMTAALWQEGDRRGSR